MSIRGLISIGTNSTRALVADLAANPPRTLLQRSIGTRIGEGLRDRGHLDEAAMQRTLEAIREHAAAIHERTGDIRVIATSALRRADNEREFARHVEEAAGAQLSVISGEEEASCSFAGAVSGVDAEPGERLGVLDVGGGSSEYATGTKQRCEAQVSCEIGAVRLTETCPELCGVCEARILRVAITRAEQALVPALQLAPCSRVVLVGGSATSAVALTRGRREPFSYAQLSRQNLEACIQRLASTPLAERKTIPAVNPQRADILLAGILIIAAFVDAAGYTELLVSTSDVLLGYLLRHAAV